jgi:hypothetical protein
MRPINNYPVAIWDPLYLFLQETAFFASFFPSKSSTLQTRSPSNIRSHFLIALAEELPRPAPGMDDTAKSKPHEDIPFASYVVYLFVRKKE